MWEGAERPEVRGGEAGTPPPGGGNWLPPVAPSPVPTGPPGWRISPKATDLAPDAQRGPEPWADPGNPGAGAAMGLSVAAFGLWCFALWPLGLALGAAGSIMGWISGRRIKRGETRKGRVESHIGLVVGLVTFALSVALLVLVLTVGNDSR
jgi:hypothetical protein